jgi:outer membrane biosynthesis protein TonB
VSYLTHVWQRFLLASSLLVGLAIGVGATVFGYSNLSTVDVHWSVLRLTGVPLWTVAVVPVALVLIAMTIYHWIDGLHHFTEHMRHRHRVHELEQEVTRLRAHLDQVLEMPGKTTGPEEKPSLPPAELEPEPQPEPVPLPAPAPVMAAEPEPPAEQQVEVRPPAKKTKRPKVTLDTAPEPHTNGTSSEAAAAAREA